MQLDQTQGVKKKKTERSLTWPEEFGINLIGVILKFLPQRQQLDMRLVNRKFKSSVETSLTKLDKIIGINNFEEYNKFIENFPNLLQIKLPQLFSSTASLIANEKLQKIEFQFLCAKPEINRSFLRNIFLKYQPLSIGLQQLVYIDQIPHLSQLKELNLSQVMQLKDCKFLQTCQNSLVSLAISIHENHDFFLQFKDIQLPVLRMLKIRLWGADFDPKKIEGLQMFVQAIPQVEVLELILDIYNDTNEKQIVFDTFMSLPSKLLPYLELKIVNLRNCTHQIIETQLNKTFDLLIFDNNIHTQLREVTQNLIEKFLAFSKILDLTNCVLQQKNQEEINQWLIEARQAPQKLIQTTNIKVQQHQFKISFDHECILTNYEQPPIVQRNEPFTTLWDSQYYSI